MGVGLNSFLAQVAGDILSGSRGADRQTAEKLDEASAAEQGRKVAEVRAAIELSDDQRTRLAAALRTATGHDVDIRVTVDPSIRGGIIARVGDTVIDGSVRHRLGRLGDALRDVA